MAGDGGMVSEWGGLSDERPSAPNRDRVTLGAGLRPSIASCRLAKIFVSAVRRSHTWSSWSICRCH